MAFSLDGPSASSLKAEARALRAEHKERGEVLSHSAALEQVAKAHGYRDWNTAQAAVPDRFAAPAQVGQRVKGTYLKQAFVGTVLAVKGMETAHGLFEVTVLFDEAVDVISFESFSAFRKRVTATLDVHGVSIGRTGDGEPHMRIRRA